MWILSIPSFTWISVNLDKQSVPYARAGHTCNVWDGQMIVVGGYIGKDISCETPGVYVFNMSSLQWTNQYTSLTASGTNNPFSQQASQKGIDSKAGLEGSYGYKVPVAVQSVIGGGANGGATITAPVQSATSGPMASGKPITYTVTGPNGAVITETSTNGGGSSGNSHQGPNIGAIVAGVVAGVLGVIALYLAFCAFIYRRQVQLYKRHVNMAQVQQAEKDRIGAEGGLFGPPGGSSNHSSWQKQNHGSLIGPYHRPSDSIETSNATSTRLGESSSPTSSSEGLMDGLEPSFWGWNGVLLHPRRSLRVVNKE